MKGSSDTLIADFLATMPPRYRSAHSTAAILEHASIAAARGDRVAHVGSFVAEASGAYGLCVVADDRPGLLAMISAALLLAKLEVHNAEAYTRRRRDGVPEGVDLFWVQEEGGAAPTAATLSDERLATVAGRLQELLEGQVAPSSALPGLSPATPTETTVRFVENDDGGLTTLEVQTTDRSGLLLALSQALFETEVQIVSSEVRTRAGEVLDRFDLLERDGSSIKPDRRLAIQVAVLAAVQEGARDVQSA